MKRLPLILGIFGLACLCSYSICIGDYVSTIMITLFAAYLMVTGTE